MEKKQTAVEIFFNELFNLGFIEYPNNSLLQNRYKEALEMEKDQIIDAFWNGDNTDCTSEQNSKQFAEQYYNETYKSE